MTRLDEPFVIVATGRDCLLLVQALEVTEAEQEKINAPERSIRGVQDLRERLLATLKEAVR